MTVIGIIAEYNPFHNGHAYQIEEIRKRTGADYIVIAMSGDFVQRGTPAIIDKYARAQMALSCGADLVLELPTLWATASAEDFAMAGVTLFDKMGCVDGICFGAETDNLPLLSLLAEILAKEPEDYKKALSSYIKEGLTFPAARAKALCDYLVALPTAPSREEIDSIINEPNNILAIEYLKALIRRNSSITPYLIKREGAGYHDSNIHTTEHVSSQLADASDVFSAPTASATAIRGILHSCEHKGLKHLTDSLSNAMPKAAQQILMDYLAKSPALCADDFSQILGYRLLTATPESLAKICDCNDDIANRLYRNRESFYSYESFLAQNKSKDVTYTRMSRILLHLLLGMDKEKERTGKDCDYIPYLRVLGFGKKTRDCAPLLATLKQTACVPLITKLADAKNRLPAQALAMLEDDIFAAALYEQVKFQKQQQQPDTYPNTAAAQNEYTRGLVLL